MVCLNGQAVTVTSLHPRLCQRLLVSPRKSVTTLPQLHLGVLGDLRAVGRVRRSCRLEGAPRLHARQQRLGGGRSRPASGRLVRIPHVPIRRSNQPPEPVFSRVLVELNQDHDTRKHLYVELERLFGRPVVSFFTSFRFPVMIEDNDADMLQGVLQKLDLTRGLVLIINSPGGYGLAAERIINVCKSYSGTGEFWAVVPGKAKSAATMVCFGASKIFMAPASELGPIDPQMSRREGKRHLRLSLYSVVASYQKLFKEAVRSKGNLEPYLQQLGNYDAREIEEFRTALALATDIAVRSLAAGMMKGASEKTIRKRIAMFLTPVQTKSHGRPIGMDRAGECKLVIEKMDVRGELWQCLYELYVRTSHHVSNRVSKCIESGAHSFAVGAPDHQHDEDEE